MENKETIIVLTIEEQIQILERTKTQLKSGEYRYTCNSVKDGIKKIKGVDCAELYRKKVSQYIPLLTFDNALAVCKKYKLKQPENNGAWWCVDKHALKSRLAFVNWMISELKKQLPLSIHEQIEILRTVKTKIETRKEYYICNGILDILFDKGILKFKNYSSFDPSIHIPLITRENAVIACSENGGCIMPWDEYIAWWDLTITYSRMVFLDWAINKLEEQL